MDTRELIWQRIEREAREQSEALTAALEITPLVVGQEVAWTFNGHMGTTDGFSVIHRVADVVKLETCCGEEIPPAKSRVAIDALWRKALRPCKSCIALQGASSGGAELVSQKDAA